MKTKDVEEYYTKYMYYHCIYSDNNINDIKEYNNIISSVKENWIKSFNQNNGEIPEWLVSEAKSKLIPKKPRTVINPRKATA